MEFSSVSMYNTGFSHLLFVKQKMPLLISVIILFVLHYRSAPAAKKKETTSIFSSKSAFSEKNNDSGESQLSVSLQSTYKKS